MRRRRRRIEYYSGEATHERFYQKAWFPFVVIIALAAVVALIVGAVLGNAAKKSRLNAFEPKALTDFGGVESPERQFRDVMAIRGDTVSLEGSDAGALRRAISDLDSGNAVGFLVYDGNGGVYFSPQLLEKSTVALNVRSSASAKEIAEAAADKGRYSVGLFVTGAFSEADEQLRILKIAEEIALMNEFSRAGVKEIVVVGLPTDGADVSAVNGYMRQARAACPNSALGVVVPNGDSDSAAISRLVACTEEYADTYFLDLRAVDIQRIGGYLEQNAYFLTAYRMRPMVSGADRETLLALLESYGIQSYLIEP